MAERNPRAVEQSDTLSAAEVELLQEKIKERERIVREQLEAARINEERLREELRKSQDQLHELKHDERKSPVTQQITLDAFTAAFEKLTREIVNLKEETKRDITSLTNKVETMQEQVDFLQNLSLLEEEAMAAETRNPFIATHASVSAPLMQSVPQREEPLVRMEPNISNNRETISCEESPLKLKDMTDSIPRYDGCKTPLYQFCKACERAKNLIPPRQEIYLVQVVLGKLYGDAATVVDGSDFVRLEPLLSLLKQVFGPGKSLNQYRGELANIYMQAGETIFKYIGRIKELKSAITDCMKSGTNLLDGNAIFQLEHDTLESFMNGLPPDLMIRLKLEGINSLEQAFVQAVRISKTMEVEKARMKPSFSQAPPVQARKDIQPPMPSENKAAFPTQILKRDQPYVKPLIPGQPGPNGPPSVTCYYCKKPGHIIAECRKLAFRKSQMNAQQQAQPSYASATGNGNRAPEQSVRRDVIQAGRSPEITPGTSTGIETTK